MIDIYFIQSILNIIWYIFSILFVLYKFTSFFSYIWNFIKFLGKFTKGVIYVSDQVKIFLTKRQAQQTELPRYNTDVNSFVNRGIDIRDDPELRRDTFATQSFFTKSKKKINEFIFGKSNNNYIPLADTRLSYINSNLVNSSLINQNLANSSLVEIETLNENHLEKSLFKKHIDSTMQSNYSDIDGFKNISIASLYPPPQNVENITITKNVENNNGMSSSLFSSELTDKPFAEETGNKDIPKMNVAYDPKMNSNMFFESTFIKKWMN